MVQLLEHSFAAIEKSSPRKGYQRIARQFVLRVGKESKRVSEAILSSGLKGLELESSIVEILSETVKAVRLPTQWKAVVDRLAGLAAVLVDLKDLSVIYTSLVPALEKEIGQEAWTPECQFAWVWMLEKLASDVLKAQDSPIGVAELGIDSDQVLEERRHLEAAKGNERDSLFSRMTSSVVQPVLVLAKRVENLFWSLPAWQVIIVLCLLLNLLQYVVPTKSILSAIFPSFEELFLTAALVIFLKEAPERRKAAIYQVSLSCPSG